MIEIKGYKGFSKDLKNEPGEQFEVGKIYRTSNEEELKFGHNGNGYHFCRSLEDCFIYFDPQKSIYAEVTGLEEVREKYEPEGYTINQISSEYSPDYEEGQIITQEPVADSPIPY